MNSRAKRLVKLFEQLDAGGQETLLAFAEFLSARRAAEPVSPGSPLAIPRPAKESVVQAIRRLRETYPMLDHGKMLHEVSRLMGQHVLHGRPAPEVIDELELLFRARYEALLAAEEETAERQRISEA